MQVMLRLAFVALNLFFLACERPELRANLQKPDIIEVETPDEAEKLFRSFTVECQDPTTCNPSVALLIAKESETSLSVCTASLVGENVVFTNKHCLPQEIMFAGSRCRGLVLVKFPEAGEHRSETVECEEVELVSPYDVLHEPKQQTDFAFVRLGAKLDRPILKFDTGGIDDAEVLKVTRMSPQMDELKGVMSDLECKAVQNTVVTPMFKSRFSPVVHVNDCPIVRGNSGSPMFGADGRIKGIIQQGKGDPQAAPLISKTFGRGTNAACIRFHSIGLNGASVEDCEQDLSDEAASQAFNALWEKQIQFEKRAAELDKRVATRVKKVPRLVKWRVESELVPFSDESYETLSGGNLMTVRLSPDCIVASELPKIASSQRTKTKFQLSEWVLRWELDDQLRLRSRLVEKTFEAIMEFSPRDIAAYGKGEFVLRIFGDLSGAATQTMRLSVCEKGNASQVRRLSAF